MNSKIRILVLCLFWTLAPKTFSNELSCSVEIDCDRFDYTSVENFNNSVIDYSRKWSLNSPYYVLPSMNNVSIGNINSISDGLTLIKNNPKQIFSVGKYVENNNKPREWLYVFEQLFLRSFNSLKR